MDPRKTRVILAIMTAVFAFAGLGAWAFASPVGSSPDEDYHLVSIWCSWGEREGLCTPGGSEAERIVSERLSDSSGCFRSQPTKSAQCSLDDARMKVVDRGNFFGEYPPIYYSVAGIFSSPNVALSTLVIRLMNVTIFVVTTAALLLLMQPGRRGPIIWGGLVTLIPLGMFLIASVNPSSWAIIAGLLLWLSVYGYLSAESRSRLISLGAISLLLGIMGAGARGDSAIYVTISAVIAMVLSFRKERSWMLRALLPVTIILTAALLFLTSGQGTGAATSTASQIAGSSAMETSGGAIPQLHSNTPDLGLLFANLLDLPWLWTGGAGTWGLGWLDTPVPVAVWVVMIGVMFALLFWGLRLMNRRKGLLLWFILLALTALPLYILQGKGLRVGEWVQPRYLLPLLVIFVSVALFGFVKDHLGVSGLQAGVLFVAVAISNSLALHNNMRRYISGLGDAGFNLNSNIEWWWNIPVSPMLVWFTGSAFFALMLLGLWLWLYPKGERPGEHSVELISSQRNVF